MSSEGVQSALNALLRGVGHDASNDIRQAWQRLTELGQDAVPAICRKIIDGDWSVHQNPTQSRYLKVLLSLLAEINKDRCQDVIVRLRREGAHPLHAKTMDIISERMAETPVERVLQGILVRVSPALSDPDGILKRIERWLRIPPAEDLTGIQTIDIIPDDPLTDYLGKFDYRFSGIVVTWPDKTEGWIRRQLSLLSTEQTLYHEVGHNAFQHAELGQVPEQEAQANRYQRKMFRRAHPLAVITAWLFFWPYPLVRMLRRKLRAK
ncbi:MAG: hypothetical protein AAFN27_01860 [Pseudomonadota bacterium]